MDYVTFPFEKFVSCITTEYDVQADSILALYIEIGKYLRDNPIVSGLTVKEIIDRYLEENPPDAGVVSVNGKTGAVTGLYDANNPPPYPVTSVNGKTGTVAVGEAGVVKKESDANQYTQIFVDESEDYPSSDTDNINLLDVYPVGSIYMAVNSTSPSSLFGGTWEQLKDRFLLGAGDTYSSGETGGTAEETLTTRQIPNHAHKMARGDTEAGSNTFTTNSISIFQEACQTLSAPAKRYISLTGTNATEGGGSHNNMPPYLVVYMWKRVS